MMKLATKKVNFVYWLFGLCAGLTFVPVLLYSLSVPGEIRLTLGLWLLSNFLIMVLLFFYNRLRNVSRMMRQKIKKN
jgi:predicted membrane channel-forming protein YqfA (hemolysin III family)